MAFGCRQSPLFKNRLCWNVRLQAAGEHPDMFWARFLRLNKERTNKKKTQCNKIWVSCINYLDNSSHPRCLCAPVARASWLRNSTFWSNAKFWLWNEMKGSGIVLFLFFFRFVFFVDLLSCPFPLLCAAFWSWKLPHFNCILERFGVRTSHFPKYLQLGFT